MRLEKTFKGTFYGGALGLTLNLLKASDIEGPYSTIKNSLENYSPGYALGLVLLGGVVGGLIDIASYLDVRSGR